MALTDAADEWDSYVAGLLAAGVPAIGFGVGLRHPRIPEALVVAAEEHGLALLEVPKRTRFSQVIQAVVEIGARHDRAQHALILEHHRELMKAASTAPAQRSLAIRLAEQIDAWVLVLGRDGQVQAASSDDARARAERVRAELHSTPPHGAVRADVDQYRVTALSIAAGYGAGDYSVSDRPGDRSAGWLVVGRQRPLSAAERSVVDAAVSLLQLDRARAAEVLAAERRERGSVFELLRSGDVPAATRTAEALGVAVPDGQVRLALLAQLAESGEQLLELLESDRGLRIGSALIAPLHRAQRIALLVPAAQELSAVRTAIDTVPAVCGVLSHPVDPQAIGATLTSLNALIDTTTGPGLVTVDELSDRAGLSDQLDSTAVRAWATEALAPLRSAEASRIDLVTTVRTFLAHNGSRESAAAELGIHRRTLGYRLSRAEALLDRSLADPTVRAELWIAFRVAADAPDVP